MSGVMRPCPVWKARASRHGCVGGMRPCPAAQGERVGGGTHRRGVLAAKASSSAHDSQHTRCPTRTLLDTLFSIHTSTTHAPPRQQELLPRQQPCRQQEGQRAREAGRQAPAAHTSCRQQPPAPPPPPHVAGKPPSTRSAAGAAPPPPSRAPWQGLGRIPLARGQVQPLPPPPPPLLLRRPLRPCCRRCCTRVHVAPANATWGAQLTSQLPADLQTVGGLLILNGGAQPRLVSLRGESRGHGGRFYLA